jgi:hypothetical protein
MWSLRSGLSNIWLLGAVSCELGLVEGRPPETRKPFCFVVPFGLPLETLKPLAFVEPFGRPRFLAVTAKIKNFIQKQNWNFEKKAEFLQKF